MYYTSDDTRSHIALSGLLAAGSRYNITPLVPITPYDGQGLWLVILTLTVLVLHCVVRLSISRSKIPARSTPADLFAEGKSLIEKAIIMYADENPQGFTNSAISTALCADPESTGEQKGWVTYKYINALCASGILERVEVFEESNERLTRAKFERAKRAFMKRFDDQPTDDVRKRFLSSPRIQRQYLKPKILYRKR